MKHQSISFLMLGAALGFAATIAWYFWGPKDFFGIPRPRWAEIVFYPGIMAGMAADGTLAHSLAGCYVAGAIAMGITGALLGALLDLLFGPKDSPDAK